MENHTRNDEKKKKKTITCEWKSSLATAKGYLY